MTYAQIGPYELLHPLGAGGMAETFQARRRGPAGFEQRVCLKRILPGRAADPRFVELFLDEARLAARLQHGCIVQVYDFGEADGAYYMALELVDGVDLEVLLNELRRRGDCLDLPMALHIAGQVLSALHYAHDLSLDGQQLGVVHRDISPSNIMISHQGEVKLTDFGIAKASGRKHKTATGHTKGKIAYMSPEQVQGETVDRRSDLFAVGVVLHEMLTGIHPFDAETDLTLLNNIVAGNRPPLTALVPGLSLEVCQLLDTLLEPALERRSASAAEVLAQMPAVESAFSVQTRLSDLVKQLRPNPFSSALVSADHPVSDGGTEMLPAAQTPGLSAFSGLYDAESAQGSTYRSKTWMWIAAGCVSAALGTLALFLWQEDRAIEHASSGIFSASESREQAAEAGIAGERRPPSRATNAIASEKPVGLSAAATTLIDTAGPVAEDAAQPIILSMPVDEGELAAPPKAPARAHVPSRQAATRSTKKPQKSRKPVAATDAKTHTEAQTTAESESSTAARSGADVSVTDF